MIFRYIYLAVKPPNRGHIGDGPVVSCREVVLFSEVLWKFLKITLRGVARGGFRGFRKPPLESVILIATYHSDSAIRSH